MRGQHIKHALWFLAYLFLFSMTVQGGFAQTVYYAPSSLEIREFIAKQVDEGSIASAFVAYEKEKPRIFRQSNGTRFLVYYTQGAGDTASFIRLIPHNDSAIVENSDITYGTWDIVFDEGYAVEKIVYYFQEDGVYSIKFASYRNVSRITVYLDGLTHVSHVIVPMALMRILRMKFDDIMQATQSSIDWEHIVPTKKHFEAYDRARHFALYVQAGLQKNAIVDAHDTETVNDARVISKIQQRFFTSVKSMLSYIREGADVEDAQLIPTYNNDMPLGPKVPTYLRAYAEKAVALLRTFPEYAAQLPQKHVPVKAHYTVRTRLYLYVLKNPECFYVIVSGINATAVEQSRRSITYDSVQVVVPYFTPSGRFSVYAEDRNAPLFGHAQDISQQNHTEAFIPSAAYRRVVVLYGLRVPNDRSYNNTY